MLVICCSLICPFAQYLIPQGNFIFIAAYVVLTDGMKLVCFITTSSFSLSGSGDGAELPGLGRTPTTCSVRPLNTSALTACTTSFGWVPPATLKMGLFPMCELCTSLSNQHAGTAPSQGAPAAPSASPVWHGRPTSHRSQPHCTSSRAAPQAALVWGAAFSTHTPPLLSFFFLITSLHSSSGSTSLHHPSPPRDFCSSYICKKPLPQQALPNIPPNMLPPAQHLPHPACPTVPSLLPAPELNISHCFKWLIILLQLCRNQLITLFVLAVQ